MEQFRVIRRVAKPFTGLFIFIVSLGIVSVVLTLVSARVLQLVTDAAFYGDFSSFLFSVKLLIAVGLSAVILAYLKTRYSATFAQKVLANLREKACRAVIAARTDALECNNPGDVLSRVSNDLNLSEKLFSQHLQQSLVKPLTSVAALVYMLLLSVPLTLLTIAIIPLAMLAAAKLSQPMSQLGARYQSSLSRLNSLVQESLKGIRVVKAYALEGRLKGDFAALAQAVAENQVKMARRMAVLYALSGFLMILPLIATFGVGGYFVIQGAVTVGGLLAFINLLSHATFPLTELASLLGEIRK